MTHMSNGVPFADVSIGSDAQSSRDQADERVVLANCLDAVSMKNQFVLLRNILEKNGYTVYVRNTLTSFEVRQVYVDGVLVATVFDPAFLTANAPALIQYDGSKLIYVTIEGVPKKSSVLYSPLPRLQYVAVSKFAATLLDKAGVRVKASFHHASNIDETIVAVNKRDDIRRRLESKFGDRVIFLFVSRNDPRKGIDKLIQANQLLKRECPEDYVILVISDPSIADVLNDDHFAIVANFGSMSHEAVLATMCASDYVVFPSKSEGFGLPVLESMSVGTPVVHTWMPPLNEFSSDEFNFVYEFDRVQLVESKLSQFFVMHEYNPQYLADSMKDAIELRKNNPSEYEEFRVKAMKHAIQWDYRQVYSSLLGYSDFEIDEPAMKEEFKDALDKLNGLMGGIL